MPLGYGHSPNHPAKVLSRLWSRVEAKCETEGCEWERIWDSRLHAGVEKVMSELVRGSARAHARGHHHQVSVGKIRQRVYYGQSIGLKRVYDKETRKWIKLR